MKTVTFSVAEADVPFVLNAIRSYADSLMGYIYNQTTATIAPSTPPAGTVTLPTAKLSKHGKRLGRPPKGAK